MAVRVTIKSSPKKKEKTFENLSESFFHFKALLILRFIFGIRNQTN